MRIILTFFLLVLSTLSFGQTVQSTYGGQISNYETGKKESGVKVTVVSGGSLLATSMTASNGKYVLKFESKANIKYDIIFSKPGFVSKRVSFDWTRLNMEAIKDGQKLNPVEDLSLELFTVKPGVDFSFLENEPIAKFEAESNSTNLKLDVSASQRMKQKIEALLDSSNETADNSDVQYNEAIKKGDSFFKDNKLEEALKQYEAAAFLKSKELYPQKKIVEIEALLNEKNSADYAQNETDKQYQNYISAADNFRDSKKYKEAIGKYRAAMRVKNEQYPKDEVAKIEKIINEAAAGERVEREFQEALTAGEAAMTAKDFEKAIAQFTIASDLKPDESYPKGQIRIAKDELKILADAKASQEKFDAAMAEGETLFSGAKFEEAKAKFTEASVLKPTEVDPKARIKACDTELTKLAAAKKLEEEIAKLFEKGEAEMEQKEYASAQTTFKSILSKDASKTVAQEKLDEIAGILKAEEDALAEKKAIQDKYDAAMKEGAALFAKENYAEAKSQFELASTTLPEESAPKDKIKACDDALAKLEAEKLAEDAAIAEKEAAKKNYDAAMAEGNSLFDAASFEEAKAKFQAASTILPEESDPKDKITACDEELAKIEATKKAEAEALANQEAQQKSYDKAMTEGEALFKEAKFEEAKVKFETALTFLPDETDPGVKIAACEAELSKLNDAKVLEAEILALYKKGETQFGEKNYTDAQSTFQEILSKDALQSKAQEKLDEISGLLKAEETALAEQQVLDEKYSTALASAEALFGESKYEEAKSKFEEASTLKPSESLPKEGMVKCDTELAKLKDANALASEIGELFAKGQSQMDSEDYVAAQSTFESILKKDASQSNAQDQLIEIAGILKAKEDALAESKALEEQYSTAMNEAESLFMEAKFNDAKMKYETASTLKPSESLPKEGIAKCETELAKLNEAEALESEIAALFNKGQDQIDAEKLTEAKATYEGILSKDASQSKAQEKIDEIDDLLKAKELALAEGQSKQESFDAAMAKGEKSFTLSKYEEAIQSFEEALSIKPEEVLPQERIDQSKEQLAKLEKAKETEAELASLFEKAQANIDKKKYEEAKSIYNEILSKDPKKNLAIVKLDEIERLIKVDNDAANEGSIIADFVAKGDEAVKAEDFALAKQNYGAALEVKQDPEIQKKFDAVLAKLVNEDAVVLVQKKYDQSIAEAEKFMAAKDFEKARQQYQNAANIDPSQSEPKKKINEIDGLLKDQSKGNKKYREAIDKGDTFMKEEKYLEAIAQFDLASEMKPNEQEPKDKSEEAARLSRESKDNDNRQFERIITAARKYIDEENIEKATDLVNRAITNRPAAKRPDDSRPEDMLAEIESLQKTIKSYNSLITAAEKAEASKDLKTALETYKRASILKPAETLPKEKIKSIEESLSSKMDDLAIEKKFQEYISTGNKNFTGKSYEVALDYYNKAADLKPDNQMVQDKISEVQQIIEEKNLANQSKAAKKLKVDALIKEANNLFDKKDWSQAKLKYQEVIALDPGQPFSQSRIAECDAKLEEEKNGLANKVYKELVASADKNFDEKDFNRAKELFEKANTQKPTDPYPIKRLNDIDLLLNPVIASSSSLEPLGDVYTGEDSDLDLIKGEKQRKNKRADEFMAVKNASVTQLEEQTDKQVQNAYASQTGLNEVEDKMAVQAVEANQRALSNVEKVKVIRNKNLEQEIENSTYDAAQNLMSQEKLNYIKKDIDVIKDNERNELANKAVMMNNQTNKVSTLDHSRSMSYNKANVDRSVELNRISIEAQETLSDEESRKLTEAQLKTIKLKSEAQTSLIIETQQTRAESNEEVFSTMVVKNNALNQNFDQKLENRSEQIKAIEVGHMENANSAYNRQMEKYLTTKDKITDQENLYGTKAIEAQTQLQKDQTKLTSLKAGLQTSDEMKSKSEKDRNVQTQSLLDYVAVKDLERNDEEAKKQNENAAVLKTIRVSAMDKETQLAADKKIDQYDSQSALTQVKSEGELATVKSTDKQEKNAGAIDDLYTIKQIRNEDLAKKAKEKQRATTEGIGSVDASPQITVVKNDIGMEFPEGVTEEKFSKKGTDGTIHTIITRRVVVIDGHGEVYVRTQSNGVSTYKKNDKSITEYVWQKETQSSKLERH